MMKVIGIARIESEPTVVDKVLHWMIEWRKVINNDQVFVDMMQLCGKHATFLDLDVADKVLNCMLEQREDINDDLLFVNLMQQNKMSTWLNQRPTSDEKWTNKLRDLKEWIRQQDATWNGNEPWTGIIAIPNKGTTAKLFQWITNQRRFLKARTLVAARISQLDAVCTNWRGTRSIKTTI